MTVLRAWLFWAQRHPVRTTFLIALALHILWWAAVANMGGDIAAQDAWADFARAHPRSAYDLAWYGGMHPVSYSVMSPYVMALFGARGTLVIAGTVCATLTAALVVASGKSRHALWPCLFADLAFFANAVSGRTTWALGTAFGLAALLVIFGWKTPWTVPGGVTIGVPTRRQRHWIASTLAVLATLGSPIAGLMVGIVAAGLWLVGRRRESLALGVPPTVVVALSALLFPFGGREPMTWHQTILPICVSLILLFGIPRTWKFAWRTTAVYFVFVIGSYLAPTPIGDNILRPALVFGGVIALVLWTSGEQVIPLRRLWSKPLWTVIFFSPAVVALITNAAWTAANASIDSSRGRSAEVLEYSAAPLIKELDAVHASLGRTEVVPTRSHAEASALAPIINLARGWNTQADADRNPLFYDKDHPLTAASYLAWLQRWAVHYVVLPPGKPDTPSKAEQQLIEAGLPYLAFIWSDGGWSLYKVTDSTEVADAPAKVISFDSTTLVVTVPQAANVFIRIPSSPWLSLLDANGDAIDPPKANDDGVVTNVEGCLSEDKESEITPDFPGETWTILRAPAAGTYRIGAPYKIPRGTACPDELERTFDDTGTSGP